MLCRKRFLLKAAALVVEQVELLEGELELVLELELELELVLVLELELELEREQVVEVLAGAFAEVPGPVGGQGSKRW